MSKIPNPWDDEEDTNSSENLKEGILNVYDVCLSLMSKILQENKIYKIV